MAIKTLSESKPNQPRDMISGRYTLKYQNVHNELNVLLLPNQQVKIDLLALLKTGSDLRNGVVQAQLPLKKNSLLYQEGACKLAFKFTNKAVVVTETNVEECGFGAFVTAQGTYVKRSNIPKFAEEPARIKP
ncbi:hypothetical protein [Gloeomargarita lithophora]|nr:hypothetical protein [Gloeomargarita lithophora]